MRTFHWRHCPTAPKQTRADLLVKAKAIDKNIQEVSVCCIMKLCGAAYSHNMFLVGLRHHVESETRVFCSHFIALSLLTSLEAHHLFLLFCTIKIDDQQCHVK
jgi:hypothetical protein